jgi:phosphonate transport system ATP-binding protein
VVDDKSPNVIFDLQCNGVKYGKKTVLLPFHLKITKGQHIAVLGASGAGKSTLLKVLFDHFNSTQKTALIPQELGLVKNLSVFHNVYIGRLDQYSTFSNLVNLVLPQQTVKNEIAVILKNLSLGQHLFTTCGKLSGGQQQRVAIARAIFRQAPILIADEPVANLDQLQAEIALKLMIDSHDSSVLALHNTDQALHYCNHIIGISNGEITLNIATTQLKPQDLTDIYKRSHV